MSEIPYIGNELDLFEKATVWKKYYGNFLAPYLKGKILEVGAGIGGTTTELCNGTQEKWICLEPDPDLFAKLEKKIQDHRLPACCSWRCPERCSPSMARSGTPILSKMAGCISA